MFTSGTTGRPKGVMCSHRPTIQAFKAWSDVVGLTEGSRYPIVNPFCHTFGYKAGNAPFDQWCTAFCNRKYSSDFSKEMTRSVEEYLSQFR